MNYRDEEKLLRSELDLMTIVSSFIVINNYGSDYHHITYLDFFENPIPVENRLGFWEVFFLFLTLNNLWEEWHTYFLKKIELRLKERLSIKKQLEELGQDVLHL